MHASSNYMSKITIEPGFKLTHWTDAQLYYNQITETDLSNRVDKAFRKVTAHCKKDAQLPKQEDVNIPEGYSNYNASQV